MKRILFIVTGFLLLVVAAAWGYWAYRQYRSYQTPIPTEAPSIVRIGVDALLLDLVWNALWNGAYYRGEQHHTPTGFSRETWSQTGIAVPANIFLYQLGSSADDASSDVYFGSVPLTDSSEFSKWLSEQPTLHVQQDTLGKFIHSDYIVATYDAERAFFALSPKKITSALPLIREKTHALMTSGKWSTVGESRFGNIRKAGGHIAVIGDHQTAIEFKNGQIWFSIVHTLKNPSVAEAGRPQFPDSNTASLWIAGVPSFLAGKSFEIGPYTLHGDSLLKYDKGNLMMEWKGTVTQQDTVISYDYDADFTMLEREELIEKSVPEIYLSIAANDGLLGYLHTQGVVDAQGLSPEAMPLYRVGVSHVDNNFLQLHTADHYSDIPKQRQATDDVLYLRVNFGRMDTASVSPALTPYIKLFDYLEASGHRTSKEKATTQGALRMRNTQINSLMQLVNALESEVL